MQEKQIIINGLSVNYKIFGEPTPLTGSLIFQKKPVLVLHGWPSSSDKWHAVAELLDRQHVMMVILDLPGFGKTPEPKTAWNLNNYVEFIHEFSKKVPELQKGFYLLGHSFGGALSAKFAIKYNQNVEKLFLVSAACVRKRTFMKSVWHQVSKIAKVFSFVPYYDMLRKAFYKFIIRKSDYPYFSGVMKETYLKVISDDLSHFLSSLRVPTIIIWGSKDNLTPLEDAKWINKKIPESKLIVIEGAGHALEIEVPKVLAEKIVESL